MKTFSFAVLKASALIGSLMMMAIPFTEAAALNRNVVAAGKNFGPQATHISDVPTAELRTKFPDRKWKSEFDFSSDPAYILTNDFGTTPPYWVEDAELDRREAAGELQKRSGDHFWWIGTYWKQQCQQFELSYDNPVAGKCYYSSKASFGMGSMWVETEGRTGVTESMVSCIYPGVTVYMRNYKGCHSFASGFSSFKVCYPCGNL
ncbi:hypothetical protein DFH27DRAFT_572093 [Peziza echinospora]|nr:hypothetical protein DFH27DRAFT_572093 [Peziza echinospora]